MDVDISYLKSLVNNESPIIFDVGCYDGRDTKKLNDLFQSAEIYAFDADNRSVELFKRCIGDKENIRLYETALSDVDGEIILYKSDSESRRHYDFQSGWSASSSIKKPDNHLAIFDDITFNDGEAVPSTRLDTWMKDKNINIVDLLWADVNGGEREFLNGGINTIKNSVRYLYIEFNSNGNDTLYSECWSKDDIVNFLPTFEELGVYNFFGNFGNVLLKNKELENA